MLERFFNALSTRGGNLAILLVVNFGLFIAVLHVLHHGDKGDVVSMIATTFSTFSGALLHALYQSKDSAVAPPTSDSKPKESL